MQILGFIAVSLLVMWYGSKRELGGGWALFFSLCFSPLAGFIIALTTPKVNGLVIIKKRDNGSEWRAIGCFAIAVFLICYGISLLMEIDSSYVEVLDGFKRRDGIVSIVLGIGFIGVAMYCSRIPFFRYTPDDDLIQKQDNP